MIYDDEFLQEINSNVDLLEYVGQHIEMKKKGKDYFGHCPLHIDKTPSFSITPEKNLYYCFSCNRSGGIIGYLMEYEGLKFEEAVSKASKLANLDLSKMCKSQTIAFLKKNKLSFKDSFKFKHEILDSSILEKYSKEEVTEWINEGIKQEVLDLFGVRIDNWQNKIIYPVYDIDNNLINIKARTRLINYKELNIPKYINYFPVGVMDYFQGLNITFPYIKGKNEVIIFESLKSVMKAYGWGYKNCVSAEKHSLTEEQLKLLIKLKVNIIFAYDSDVSYKSNDVKQNIDKLKRITNVYIIEDKNQLLGGRNAKNAPVDLGEDIWIKLYNKKIKIV